VGRRYVSGVPARGLTTRMRTSSAGLRPA
jgi:hypothetical protein